MNKKFWNKKKILITGSSGFIGKNLVEYFQNNIKNLSISDLLTPSRKKLDLLNPNSVNNFFNKNRPNIVFHLAAKQGGIAVNKKFAADFFYENSLLNLNVLHSSHLYGVEKIISTAAGSCYPVDSKNPLQEKDIFKGIPNYSHYGYSMSKRNLIVQSELYKMQYKLNSVVLLPSNIYGKYVNINPISASVLPALTYKFFSAVKHNKKTIKIWGSMNTTREFMHVDDFISILIESAERIKDLGPFNVGTGNETKIIDLVRLLKIISNYKGKIEFESDMLIGQNKRCFNLDKFNSNFRPRNFINLELGLKHLYEWISKLDN